MQFHILYMPGTVRYLTPMVNSLLHWSDCGFRLVANGCDPAEKALLAHFCDSEPRLEYMALPSSTTVSHGEALTILQEANQEPYFCFMDSDIFATAPFLPATLPEKLNDYGGLFSCTPLWCTPQESILPDDYPQMFGRHSHTQDGLCLGNSYFAIYNNRRLHEVIKNERIDFTTRRWSLVAPPHQAMLRQMDLVKEYYDTGKLINLLLHQCGCPSYFQENVALHHIGGFSRFLSNSSSAWSERVRSGARSLWGRNWRGLLVQLPYWFRFDRRYTRDSLSASILARQVSVERYFSQLIVSLVDHTRPPTWKPIGDEQLAARYERTAKSLVEVYA